MSEEIIQSRFMGDDFDFDESSSLEKKYHIFEFYSRVKRAGLCLCTVGWRDERKEERHRIYCFKPVTQVWFIYVHSLQEWHATTATCENHTEYNIIGIRDRETHPEDPRNHAISAPWPHCGDYHEERLRHARLDPIPTTYP